MGLYDRDYMREDEPGFFRPGRRAPWSPTITLLVVLVIVYILELLIPRVGNEATVVRFGLSLDGIQQGRLWQLITFQFLHGGILHILLNGFALYSLGRFMEEVMGRPRFLTLYFVSGLMGGLLQLVAIFALRQNPYIPMVGASAGIAGLLGAFAAMFPRRHLTLFILFFPVTVRASALLWFAVGISVLGMFWPFGGVAHAAHLGGLLAGLGCLRLFKHLSRVRADYDAGAVPPVLRRDSEPPREEDSREFIAQEVDPILEKIATHGIHSLTDRERKILEIARARMNKR